MIPLRNSNFRIPYNKGMNNCNHHDRDTGIIRKHLHKMSCHKYTKDCHRGYDENKGDKKRPNIRPKYQPPAKKELL